MNVGYLLVCLVPIPSRYNTLTISLCLRPVTTNDLFLQLRLRGFLVVVLIIIVGGRDWSHHFLSARLGGEARVASPGCPFTRAAFSEELALRYSVGGVLWGYVG